MDIIFLQIGIIYFLGHLFAFVFRRFKIPDVLLFMILGLILGPTLSFVTPEHFGRAGAVLSTLALVVILFESGTTLNVKSLAGILGSGTLLTMATMVITGGLAFAASLPFTHSVALSSLTAIILAGTSSAVVIPMATALNIGDKLKNVLILESSLTDVLCIVLTLAVVRALGEGGVLEIGAVSLQVLLSFAVALVLGIGAGLAWSYLKQRMPFQFATIAFAITVYGIVEFFGFSGPIAVMSMGVTLANAHIFHRKENGFVPLTPMEFGFYSELVFVLKTFFFIYLGISMRFDKLSVLPIAVVFIAALIGLRALLVKFIFKSDPSNKEKAFVALLLPKGLAAAVLAGIPVQEGLVGAEIIPQIVFPTVLVSIVLVSVLVPIADKKFSNSPE